MYGGESSERYSPRGQTPCPEAGDVSCKEPECSVLDCVMESPVHFRSLLLVSQCGFVLKPPLTGSDSLPESRHAIRQEGEKSLHHVKTNVWECQVLGTESGATSSNGRDTAVFGLPKLLQMLRKWQDPFVTVSCVGSLTDSGVIAKIPVTLIDLLKKSSEPLIG